MTDLASPPSESGGSFDFFLDDNIDFRVRSSKANLDMVQQMRDMDRFLLFGARSHAHQLSYLFVQVVPIEDHGHWLVKQLCQLTANCSGAINSASRIM